MKKFIEEYLHIIGYCLIGLIFAYSSFYFLINLYHQKELNRKIQINMEENVTYNSIVTKINLVNENISDFNTSKYKGSVPVHQILNIQGRIQNCTRKFENEVFVGLKEKSEIGVLDVEELRLSFQNEILSTCLVEQIYDIAVTDKTNRFSSNSLKTIAPYLELDIKNLLASNNYMTSDIQNNNIYYFTTEHTNTNLLNKTRLGFSEVLSSYDRSIDLLVRLSEWFKEEVNK